MIRVFVAGDPKGQPRPRAFTRRLKDGTVRARVFDAGSAEEWKSQVALALKPHLPRAPWRGAVALTLAFHFRRPMSHYRKDQSLKPKAPRRHLAKPDVDNLAKAVMDACTAMRVWEDDDQVTRLVVIRRWADPGTAPGLGLELQPLDVEDHVRAEALEGARRTA